jgi:multidrug transporter EmrE-like cation transporter
MSAETIPYTVEERPDTGFNNATLGIWLFIASEVMLFGGLFSAYLVGLQAFVIKAWCIWCLGVAFSNLVLIVSLFGIPNENIFPILSSQKVLWVIVHNIGFILGVGAATITDIFFFKFLKDNIITQEEKDTMDTLSAVIWAGLAILIVSGLALYLPEQARLAVSSKFLIKVVVVGVIVLNGFLLNMIVAPNMRRLSFEGGLPEKRFRRLAFALGGISFSSWYIAFFLGALRKIPVDFNFALWAYLGVLVFVVIGSQVTERFVTKGRLSQKID